MDFNFTPGNESKDPLKDFGRNITEMALKQQLEPIIGRDDEIRRVIRILSRKTKNNPVLVGEPGVGKTAIVEGLAIKIASGDVPENLKGKEIFEIDMASMLAGASFQGQFEKRVKDLVKKIEESNGTIILFIDEIHTLVGTGRNSEGSLDVAQIFKPLLARGRMKLIGATTYDEYRKYIEKDLALERRMQKVIVNEPTPEQAITILRGIKQKLEAFHRVKIQDNALVKAVELSTRYITDRFLPDKAIDLVDEAAAAIQTEIHSKPEALEKAEQKLAMLKMEEVALASEETDEAKTRRSELKNIIKESEASLRALRDEWASEKEIVKNVAELKNKIASLKLKQQRSQNDGDYDTAARLLYKDIPEAEQKLKAMEEQATKRATSLVRENVTENEIAAIVSTWTQIPVTKLLATERQKLLSLPKQLEARIKGQSNALSVVTEAVLRAKAEINDPNRPLASFIFMGPTGVGKTEVAKALAEELFESERNMIRIDMSEYMEAASVARFIGAPPGYIGYEEGGQLTEAVRRHPYSIILFDEIEKANPKVLDILLQVLDEGMLTDGRGKHVNFKNTIIIMTTNIASEEILKGKWTDDQIRSALQLHLRPEFINRIDEVVIFKALTERALIQIANNELEKVSARLKKSGYLVSFHKDVAAKVVASAYEPQFGARPLNRYIKRSIESMLAHEIVGGKIIANKHYRVVTKDETFSLEKVAAN